MEIEEHNRQLTEIAELLHPNPWHSEYPYVDNPEPPPSCGASLTFGGADPSGTECDLGPDHEAEKHEGPDPFAATEYCRVSWKGGGSCAGDPLPVSDVHFFVKED